MTGAIFLVGSVLLLAAAWAIGPDGRFTPVVRSALRAQPGTFLWALLHARLPLRTPVLAMKEAAIMAKFRKALPEKIAGLEQLTFHWRWPEQGLGRSIELVIHDEWGRVHRLEISEKRCLAGHFKAIQDDIERLALYALEPPPLYVP